MKRLVVGGVLLFGLVAAAFGPNATSGSLTVANSNSNAGACTANSCVQQVLQIPAASTIFTGSSAGFTTTSAQVTGTWSGTITFQESQDEGATWSNLPCQPIVTSATNLSSLPVTSTTANGNWRCDVAGYTSFRAVMSSFSSGTAVVVLEQFIGPSSGLSASATTPFVTDPQQRLVQGASTGVSYNYTSLEALGTAAKALAAVEADGTNRLYLRQLTVCLDEAALQTGATERRIVVYPTTAASASGSTVAPIPLDAASAAFGGIARTGALTTTPAIGSVAEAQALDEFSIFIPAAVTTSVLCVDRVYDGTRGLQPLAVAKGVANGFAVGQLVGGAGGTGNYVITMKFSAEPK